MLGAVPGKTDSHTAEETTTGMSYAQKTIQSQGHTLQARRTRLPAIVTLLTSKRLLASLLGTLVEGAIFSGLETVCPFRHRTLSAGSQKEAA